ncbi:hypothetical protein [Burkholderia metallica]|uniref:hypothetical protein n=1 Tax=Burkholderia metallica TaxID=488729 RepID=UPI001CF31C0C|nr:hypothetical protein [Burkholderia metallica]MCA8023619.1 hypothetical protein [Burkholderia metallica]
MAAEIARLMSDNQHWTIMSIAKALNVTGERVKVAMRKLLNAHLIYHSQRIEPSHTNAYRLISAAQATSSDLTVEQVHDHDAKRETEIDQRYRRQAPSWPIGDDVLMKAMHAMVKTREPVSTDN